LLTNNFKGHSGGINANINQGIDENTRTIDILESQINFIHHSLHLIKEEVVLNKFKHEREISKIKQNETQENYQVDNNLIVQWTASKTALVELIYALQAEGVFNNGKADIKTIVSFFETLLNINLSECYRLFHQIKMRKIERTKFLDSLKWTLEKCLDESDND
jgi:hypothetical protein